MGILIISLSFIFVSFITIDSNGNSNEIIKYEY